MCLWRRCRSARRARSRAVKGSASRLCEGLFREARAASETPDGFTCLGARDETATRQSAPSRASVARVAAPHRHTDMRRRESRVTERRAEWSPLRALRSECPRARAGVRVPPCAELKADVVDWDLLLHADYKSNYTKALVRIIRMRTSVTYYSYCVSAYANGPLLLFFQTLL